MRNEIKLKRKAISEHVQNCLDCTSCPIGKSRPQRSVYRGIPYADILFIMEPPDDTDIILGQPTKGPTARVFQNLMNTAWKDYSPQPAFVITNSIRCLPETDGRLRKPNKDELYNCSDHLLELIEITEPGVIVTGSDSAIKALKPLEIDIPVLNMISVTKIMNQGERGKLDFRRAVKILQQAYETVYEDD